MTSQAVGNVAIAEDIARRARRLQDEAFVTIDALERHADALERSHGDYLRFSRRWLRYSRAYALVSALLGLTAFISIAVFTRRQGFDAAIHPVLILWLIYRVGSGATLVRPRRFPSATDDPTHAQPSKP